MENRFSTMTEVRNVLWPAYETPEYDAANFLQGIAGTLELFHRSALAFQELAEEATGHPVAVFQRIDQAGYKLPIDERILADTDTLMVFGLDHLLSEQEAAPEEIAAITEWLQREGTCLLLAPHHDVGFTDDYGQRQVEYEHHGDRLVPRQQRFSQYTRSLMRALDVPVHNIWGLRPAVVEGTKEIAPLTAIRDLDSPRLLDNVTTFNFHPHLPHYELTAPESDGLTGPRTPARRPEQAAPVHRGGQHGVQRADLDAADRPARGRHRPHRLHALHHAVRRHRQPAESVAQPGHDEVRPWAIMAYAQQQSRVHHRSRRGDRPRDRADLRRRTGYTVGGYDIDEVGPEVAGRRDRRTRSATRRRSPDISTSPTQAKWRSG